MGGGGLGEFTDGVDPALEGEDRLRASLALNKPLLDQLHDSENLREWLAGPGRGMHQQMEQRFFDALQGWLSTNYGTEENRLAHFNARVAMSMLQDLKKVIDAGAAARTVIMNNDRELNGEPTDGE